MSQQTPADAETVERVARLILSVSIYPWDGANEKRRAMAREAARVVLADIAARALAASPEPVSDTGMVVVPREVAQALFSYGSIHTVKNVVVSMPHKQALEALADAMLPPHLRPAAPSQEQPK